MEIGKYEKPLLVVVELCAGQAVLSGSPTGEVFDSQDSYDGSWS